MVSLGFRRIKNTLTALTLAGLLLYPHSIRSQENGTDITLQNMADGLVRLRTEVESLSTKLELRKREIQNQLESLATQKKDLERQRKNIESKMAEMRQKIDRHTEEIEKKEKTRRRLKPIILNLINYIRGYVRSNLPFKVAERLNELDKLADNITRDEVPADKAFGQLWSMVEDELRMTKESGLYRQNILLGGRNSLADVARLGMVLMYFKTIDDGKVGYAARSKDGWVFLPVENRDDAKRIRYLFDCLQKHIREGFYELPNPGREGVSL